MFEEYEDEEWVEPTGPGADLADDMLWRLYQVWLASRRGFVDQGFPRLHNQMEAKGLVQKSGDGWQITGFGEEIVKAQHERIRKM